MAKRSKKSMLEGIGDMISQIGGIEGVKSVCILQPDGHRKCLPRQFKSGTFLSSGDKRKRTVAVPKGRSGQGKDVPNPGKTKFTEAADACRATLKCGPKSKSKKSCGPKWKACMSKELGTRSTPKKTSSWEETTRTGRARKYGPRRPRKAKKG